MIKVTDMIILGLSYTIPMQPPLVSSAQINFAIPKILRILPLIKEFLYRSSHRLAGSVCFDDQEVKKEPNFKCTKYE